MYERGLFDVSDDVTRRALAPRVFTLIGGAVGGLLLVLVAGCSGGSSTHTASLHSYCQELKKSWPTLAAASSKATAVWMDSQTPGALQPQLAQELKPDSALYEHAASMARSLAALAPTAIKNDINTDKENARARFLTMATGFSQAAHDKTKDLGNLDMSALDAGSTGCDFGSNQMPDGSVATQFNSN